MPLESEFQKDLMDELRDLFPGCVILKNDSSYQQGIPDWLILWGPHWAMLETKKSRGSRYEANQEYFLEILDEMSIARRVQPENRREVIRAIQQAFGSRR